MKICWDDLDGFVLSKKGNLRNRKRKKSFYIRECKLCKEEFLCSHKNQLFCSLSCSSTGSNNGMFGKKSLGLSGRKHSEETKRKVRLKHSDGKFAKENNPNWKGGLSYEIYPAIFQNKKFKKSILKRDRYKCLNPNCECTSTILVVHHIDYNKQNCSISNLITLCNSCNARANFNRERHQVLYNSLLRKRYNYEN